MGSVIGQTLPLAVGVAISPIPIIAAILMLLSPKARTTSAGFLVGWLAGILIATTVFTLLSSALPEDDDSAKPVLGAIQLLLGVGLLLLAAKQWRSRPKDGAEPAMPGWMQKIDSMSFGGALGLGLLLSGVNPKNLLLAASAGMTIGPAALGAGATALVVAIFTVIAGSTVLIPVIGYLFAAERLAKPLESLRAWLTKENATIMAVLLLVIGTVVLGKGIGSF